MDKRPIVHVEIPAKDRQYTARFYADIFGWDYEDQPSPVPYTMFHSGNTGGGYPELSDMYKPGDVLIYIHSHDLEADLRQIEARGGTVITREMEIPGFGQLAFFSDPAGNRIALWKTEPAHLKV